MSHPAYYDPWFVEHNALALPYIKKTEEFLQECDRLWPTDKGFAWGMFVGGAYPMFIGGEETEEESDD